MAQTPSTMRALGSSLPAFQLVDVKTDQIFDSAELAGKISVITFICNHCPFVRHLNQDLVAFGRFCEDQGVSMIAISSNDVSTHPMDGPLEMERHARDVGYPFPYLYDETQEVARTFDAACTPDFFVFDAAGRLAYRGQFDDSRPGNGVPVTGRDLRAAVDALVEGKRPDLNQKPSIGCNIKWKV